MFVHRIQWTQVVFNDFDDPGKIMATKQARRRCLNYKKGLWSCQDGVRKNRVQSSRWKLSFAFQQIFGTTCIVSASLSYIVEPIAYVLYLSHVLASRQCTMGPNSRWNSHIDFTRYFVWFRSEEWKTGNFLVKLKEYIKLETTLAPLWINILLYSSIHYYYTYWLKMISNKKELQGNNNDCVILRYATCGGGAARALSWETTLLMLSIMEQLDFCATLVSTSIIFSTFSFALLSQ